MTCHNCRDCGDCPPPRKRMMMDTVTIPVSLPRGEDEVEIEIEVRGTYHPARDATPPRYDCGGEPPEPARFEIDSVRCGGIEVDADVEKEIEAALRQSLEAVCLEEIKNGSNTY